MDSGGGVDTLCENLTRDMNEAARKLQESRLRFRRQMNGFNLSMDSEPYFPLLQDKGKFPVSLRPASKICCPNCTATLGVLPKFSSLPRNDSVGSEDGAAGDSIQSLYSEQNINSSELVDNAASTGYYNEHIWGNEIHSQIKEIPIFEANEFSEARNESLTEAKPSTSSSLDTHRKSTIFRLPGTSSSSIKPDGNGNSLLRSRSYVVIPAPIVIPTDAVNPCSYSYSCSGITINKDINSNFALTLSKTDPNIKGLDAVEEATFYNSSASSSRSSIQLDNVEEFVNLPVSKIDRYCATVNTIHSGYSTTDCESESEVEETEGITEIRSPLKSNKLDESTKSTKDDIFHVDIPEQRKDLYRDSLTLFLDKCLGK